MFKILLKYLLPCLLLVPLLSAAQQVETIRGIIYKKGMLEKLAGVSVMNTKTKIGAASNLFGEFSVKAGIGDTLLLEKDGFTPVKQVVTSYSTLYVTMLPEIRLEQVTIKGQSKKQELNEVVNVYRSKGLYYDGKPPITAFLPFGGSPLTGLNELFSKDAKNERRFIKYSKQELEASEVHRRYTPALVTKVTGLTGTAVQTFMFNYTPAFDDVKKWNDYELIQYIKKSYEGYQKEGNSEQSAAEVFKKSNP